MERLQEEIKRLQNMREVTDRLHQDAGVQFNYLVPMSGKFSFCMHEHYKFLPGSFIFTQLVFVESMLLVRSCLRSVESFSCWIGRSMVSGFRCLRVPPLSPVTLLSRPLDYSPEYGEAI